MRTAVVVGGTSTIGSGIAERLAHDGWRVFVTARDLKKIDQVTHAVAVECDVSRGGFLSTTVQKLLDFGITWDLVVVSVGTLEPVGKFFDVDPRAWCGSVEVNFLGQMMVVRQLWPLRRRAAEVHIALFAGAGTNGPATNYSAYCVSKIAIIKMCELLSDEEPELNAFAIGPGFVHAKIHRQTLAAGRDRAGAGYDKLMDFLETDGTSLDDVYRHLMWCVAAGRDRAGGRNFSTVHDPWRVDDGSALEGDPDAARLRRRWR